MAPCLDYAQVPNRDTASCAGGTRRGRSIKLRNADGDDAWREGLGREVMGCSRLMVSYVDGPIAPGSPSTMLDRESD